jgi:prepilin-type N-terminal cleavage/methylation domain-containing protein
MIAILLQVFYYQGIMHKRFTTHSGFTIVELLIVIVVIAILAAISVMAYTGIQQRANNTNTISAAAHTIKLLEAYRSINGSYPSGFWMACVGEYDDDTCRYTNSGATVEAAEVSAFKTAIATVGTMPQPPKKMFVLASARVGGGVMFVAGTDPKQVSYYLEGLNQTCGAGGTAANSNTATSCTIALPN